MILSGHASEIRSIQIIIAMKIRFSYSNQATIFFSIVLILFAALKTFADSSFQLEFSPNGDKILSSRLGDMQIWETNSGKLLQKFERSDERYWSFASFAAAGRYILLIDNKANAAWYEIRTGKFTSDTQIKLGAAYAVSADKKLLSVVSRTGEDKETISLYDIGEGKLSLRKEITSPLSGISNIHFLKGNKNLLTIDFSPAIISLETGKIEREFSAPDVPYRFAIAPDLNSLLIINRFSTNSLPPYVLDLKSARKHSIIMEKRYMKLFSEVNVAGYSSFNSDTIFLAGKSNDSETGVLIIWNTKTGRAQKVMANEKEIISAAFSPDGKNILYQDLAGKTILANSKTGMRIHEYKIQSQPETNSSAF